MAIAPIDLQTIFTQVDKVGKTQIAQKEGQALAQEIQGVQIQKKNEEHIHQVNETQNMGDGTEKIGDERGQRQGGEGRKQQNRKGNETLEEQEEPNLAFFRDPALGNKIDISL